MAREPTFSPPPLGRRADLNLITHVREYRLITPLFGGGVNPREADPITTVRATEVRGHLRFWWRATRGGQFDGDLARMKAAEDLLWGAASTKDRDRPSLVQVEVVITDRGRPFDPEDTAITDVRSSFSYVSFPLQNTGATVLEGVKFRLHIAYPSNYQSDIEAALWAWELFGGLGARTRRGFGAIARDGEVTLPADPLKVREEIEKQMMPEHLNITGQWVDHVPHVHAGFVLLPFDTDAIRVWKRLFTLFKSFRQPRPQHRRWYLDQRTNQRKQRSMPGRNHWPEPDEIRRRTRMRANFTDPAGNVHDHSSDVSSVPAFPRAAFGLPIQFEFKDRQRGDPEGKNLLRGVLRQADGITRLLERLASPLILRPIPCVGGYLGVALRLAGTNPPDDLNIDVVRGATNARWRITAAQATQVPEFNGQGNLQPNPLMQDRQGRVPADVIEGFFNFLRRNGGV